MAVATIPVNNEILKWVLQTSSDTLNKEWIARVKGWITTDKNPTVNQVRQLSKTSKLPFGYFFLKKPPKIELPLLNFRTINNDEVKEPSKELIDTVYEMQEKVNWLSEYREKQGQSRIIFAANVDYEQSDAIEQAAEIQQYFGLKSDWNLNEENPFNYLRRRLTNYGITVNVNGTHGLHELTNKLVEDEIDELH